MKSVTHLGTGKMCVVRCQEETLNKDVSHLMKCAVFMEMTSQQGEKVGEVISKVGLTEQLKPWIKLNVNIQVQLYAFCF